MPPAKVPPPVIRAAQHRAAAPGQVAGVGQALGEGHAHARAERGRGAGEERGQRAVGSQRDRGRLGARVDSDPSIRPLSAGWTRSKQERPAAGRLRVRCRAGADGTHVGFHSRTWLACQPALAAAPGAASPPAPVFLDAVCRPGTTASGCSAACWLVTGVGQSVPRAGAWVDNRGVTTSSAVPEVAAGASVRCGWCWLMTMCCCREGAGQPAGAVRVRGGGGRPATA